MLKFERMNVDFKEKKIFITAKTFDFLPVKLQIFPLKGTAIERRDIRSLNIPLLKV